MKVTELLDLFNSSDELMKLTNGIKSQLFRVEDVEPVDDGARIVLIPMDWGNPSEWGSDKPQRRNFDFQINVESSDFALSLAVADKVEEILLNNKVFRDGDTISDNIEYLYVIARRYRFRDFLI